MKFLFALALSIAFVSGTTEVEPATEEVSGRVETVPSANVTLPSANETEPAVDVIVEACIEGGCLGDADSLDRKEGTYWIPLDAVFDKSGEYFYILDDERRLWGYDFNKWDTLEDKEDSTSMLQDFDKSARFIRVVGDDSLVVVGDELAFVEISDPNDVMVTQLISTDDKWPCSLDGTEDLAVVGGEVLFTANKKSPQICSFKRNSEGIWEINSAVSGIVQTCNGEFNTGKRLEVDTVNSRLIVACSRSGFEVFDVDVEQGTLTSLSFSRFDYIGEISVFHVIGRDLYASVGSGFKRFLMEPESGDVIQGEGAVIFDGEGERVFITDMVTSSDGVNIYVLKDGGSPRVLTFFRDALSGGLRHRDTSAEFENARHLAYNHANDRNLVILSDNQLNKVTRETGAPTRSPTRSPSQMPTTAEPTTAPPSEVPTSAEPSAPKATPAPISVETFEPTGSPTVENVGKTGVNSDDRMFQHRVYIGIGISVVVFISFCVFLYCLHECKKSQDAESLLNAARDPEQLVI